MRWTRTIRLRLRSVFLRDRVEQDLDEELRYHLDREIAQSIGGGMTEKDARRAARRSIADIEQRKEECRDMRRVNTIDNAVQDFRYAWRGLRKSPGFAALAVLVMALGIGANTAVFSVVNGVLLKPLAYREPDRMVTLTTSFKGGVEVSRVSRPDLEDWHDQSTAFSAMAYYRRSDEAVSAGAATEYVRVARVSREFFDAVGVSSVAGRLISAEEQRSADSAAVLISYGYWQSHFGGSPAVLGAHLRISGDAVTVVGVMPARFQFPDHSDIWRPADAVDRTLPRTSLSFQAIGRLRPGVSLERAQAQLTSIAQGAERRFPDSNRNRGVTVAGMRDDMVSDVRLTLYLLLGAVCLVLLIACANVATLLLTRATARTREIAIRAAIGAARGRIVRQLMTESLLLALLGGAAGLAVAAAGLKAIVALAPADVPRLGEVSIDARVLAFTFGASVICSLIFGLVPVVYASRIDLNSALKQSGGRAVAGGGSSGLRGGLVIAEVALSVMLLAGAGLLIRSFVALQNVALGFRPERVLVMKATLPVSGPDGDSRARQFFKQLVPAVASLPGVAAAGATMGPPGDVESSGSVWFDHAPERPNFNTIDTVFSVVTPGTFGALGIPLKRGRDFDGRDSADASGTVVINEELARRSYGEQDPIGRIIFAGFDALDKPMKIVGVVGDVRQWGQEKKPGAEIYMPYQQHVSGAGSTLCVVARTAAAPEAMVNTLRRTVRGISPDVPLKFSTMEASLYEEIAAPRFRTLLLGIFAGLSLALAMAGVYGVTAYVVGQRSSEIGLRIAMGATPGDVLRLLLRHGMKLAGAGMALGLASSLGGTRLMRSMLFEVAPGDPLTYAGVAVLLGAMVLAAIYIPARRATRLDPLAALRQE